MNTLLRYMEANGMKMKAYLRPSLTNFSRILILNARKKNGEEYEAFIA